MSNRRQLLLGVAALCWMTMSTTLAYAQVAVPRVALLACGTIVERLPNVKFIGFYEGQVLRVTKSEVIIRPFYFFDHKSKRSYSGREATEEFHFSKPLAAGQRPTSIPGTSAAVPSAYGYRATQLQICDVVDLEVYTVDGRRECWAVSILRRTGGEVPLAQDEKEAKHFPWHRRCRAYQAFEEHGVPLPEKWGGKDQEKVLTARLKTVNEILETAKAADKEKK